MFRLKRHLSLSHRLKDKRNWRGNWTGEGGVTYDFEDGYRIANKGFKFAGAKHDISPLAFQLKRRAVKEAGIRPTRKVGNDLHVMSQVMDLHSQRDLEDEWLDKIDIENQVQ